MHLHQKLGLQPPWTAANTTIVAEKSRGGKRERGAAMSLKRIHHTDCVVRDLDSAVAKYREIFNVSLEDREQLESRGGRFI